MNISYNQAHFQNTLATMFLSGLSEVTNMSVRSLRYDGVSANREHGAVAVIACAAKACTEPQLGSEFMLGSFSFHHNTLPCRAVHANIITPPAIAAFLNTYSIV